MRLFRNILNIIFIFGALIGMYIYYKGDTETGTIIIIVAMAFKFVEVIIRLLKLEDKN
jgi:hypothetical protein